MSPSEMVFEAVVVRAPVLGWGMFLSWHLRQKSVFKTVSENSGAPLSHFLRSLRFQAYIPWMALGVQCSDIMCKTSL